LSDSKYVYRTLLQQLLLQLSVTDDTVFNEQLCESVCHAIPYFNTMTIAEKINSRALRAEAKESLICDLQDLTVLLGWRKLSFRLVVG
jgi:hypothetical protein